MFPPARLSQGSRRERSECPSRRLSVSAVVPGKAAAAGLRRPIERVHRWRGRLKRGGDDAQERAPIVAPPANRLEVVLRKSRPLLDQYRRQLSGWRVNDQVEQFPLDSRAQPTFSGRAPSGLPSTLRRRGPAARARAGAAPSQPGGRVASSYRRGTDVPRQRLRHFATLRPLAPSPRAPTRTPAVPCRCP